MVMALTLTHSLSNIGIGDRDRDRLLYSCLAPHSLATVTSSVFRLRFRTYARISASASSSAKAAWLDS